MSKKNMDTVNSNTKIYSPEKVAEIMEVKKSFVMRLLRDGQLKGVKLGKFWRVPEEYLNDYFTNCDQNGNGKKRMSADAKNKIRYHANLKSQDVIPKTLEKVEETIQDIKDDLQNQTGFKKVATIAKLQSAVTLREELKSRLGSMDKTLDTLGSKAYPEQMLLMDKDADSLEALFMEAVNAPKGRMIDLLDREAQAMVKEDDNKEPQAMAIGE